jgi:hypothetical protein
MFDAVVSVFDKLVSRPGLRSVLLAVLVFGTIACGLVGFEAYTAHFRLQRLTATAELIASLQQSEEVGLSNPSLVRAHESLIKELDYLMPQRSGSIVSTSAPPVVAQETLWKFLAGGALWWLASLYALGAVFRREKSSLTGFVGIIIFGIAFGGIGAALPTVYWPWFNLLLYPLGHVFVVMLAFAGFGMDLVRARDAGNAKVT